MHGDVYHGQWYQGDMHGKVLAASCYISFVVVNLLFQLIFIFPLFLGMVMYANTVNGNGKYLIIHSPHGFSGIIYSTGWETLPDCLINMQFTSNDGMRNDAPHT